MSTESSYDRRRGADRRSARSPRRSPADARHRPAPVVTVRGEARLEVPPDLARFSVTVHATRCRRPNRSAPSWPTASGRLRDSPGRAPGGAGPVQHQRAARRPGVRRTGTKITGYRGSFSTSVVVPDFDALSDVVFALTPLPEQPGRRSLVVAAPRQPGSPRGAARGDRRRPAAGRGLRRARSTPRWVTLLEISDLDGGFGGPPMRMAKGFAMDAESAPVVRLRAGHADRDRPGHRAVTSCA